MEIKNHILKGKNIVVQNSPNHGGKFAEGALDTIIIHYTAGSSAESSVKTLCNPKIKASAHLVVGRDGSITQLVPFNTIAWHAGKSSHQGRVGLKKYSIGIEIDNAGRLTKSGTSYAAWFGRKYDVEDVVEAVHRNESALSYWHAYTEEQIASVNDICEELIETYQINSILGHEEIAPQRKSDPGPAFPLDKFREHLLMRNRSQEDAAEPARNFSDIGLVTASKLNVRETSRRNAKIISAPLIKGTLVNIVGEKNGWYEVDIKTRGWVKKDYIKT